MGASTIETGTASLDMQYRVLGRTGMKISRVSIGAGGLNTWGQRTPRKPEREIHRLIHRAFDLGVNLFDVAPAYCDAEGILGRAMKGISRDRWHICTKVKLGGGLRDEIASPLEVRQTVENSLRRLQTDVIDILLMAHWPDSVQYARIVESLVPTLERLKKEGKVRAVGATEVTRRDGAHEWLTRGLHDDLFDVVMAGYNLINQSAERELFPLCRRRNIGVMSIFTARRTFNKPERLKDVVRELMRKEIVDAEGIDPERPLDWLLQGEVKKMVNAAYKFSAACPDITTIVSGTINEDHLEENIRMVLGEPIAEADRRRLKQMFRFVAEPVGN